MRVWAVSDIHTDYPQNLAWARQWADSGGGAFKQDALIVAGDISDSLDTLAKTLEIFAAVFGWVFYVPGNHDLWVRRDEKGKHDSLQKVAIIEQLCERLGVHTRPACVGLGVWIVPILSWYHASWDREPDVPGASNIQNVMLDFHVCNWGSNGLNATDDSLARHFDGLNDPAFGEALQRIEQQAAEAGGARPPIISFSHFLPRQELLPEKRMLYHPNLAKASGSDYVERRIRQLRPDAHVFGHTHFTWDAEIEGVRYVQWPLGYPHESSRRKNGTEGWTPLPLFDTAAGGLARQRDCYWSEYYAVNRRDPSNVTPAPWASVSTRSSDAS